MTALTTAAIGAELKATVLRERHERLGARMVPFAGWLMPVQYSGIFEEHRVVRTAAGLFDLGHMGQVRVSGKDALPFLQFVTTNDVSRLHPGEAQYSLLPNPDGGVIDDIIVYRWPDEEGYFVVVNAANHDKDVTWLHQQRTARKDLNVDVADVSSEFGMIAIQGPRAEAIVGELTRVDLNTIAAFQWQRGEVAGIPVMIARTGYTGEDGFEFYVPQDRTVELWDALMQAGEPRGLAPVGLGARDTLRLEARMPLYGNELADDISPLEAGLGWAVNFEKGPFIGSDHVKMMKASGVPRRTVGFELLQRAGSARHGYTVQLDGREIGAVTSGARSPTLGTEIGLALIDASASGLGRPLQVVIRGRPVQARQVKLPFYRRNRD